MVSENAIDIYSTEPGTLAGRYLRSFWQPVYRAKDLPAGEAVPLRIMKVTILLFKLGDFAPWREEFPNPRCHQIPNHLRSPRKFLTIVVQRVT